MGVQTMGTSIVRERVTMPVLVLKVMGPALDYHFVDFGFNRIDRALFDDKWNHIGPFRLRTGSYVVPINEIQWTCDHRH